MRLVRVGSSSVLPPETPWTDCDDKCRQRDTKVLDRGSSPWNETDNEHRRKARRKDVDPTETRKPNHIPARWKDDWSNNRRSSCETEAFPNRLTSRRDLFDAREVSRSGTHTKSYARSKDIDRGTRARHTSSSRCYAPRDHPKLGSPGVSGSRRTGENKVRSPVKRYGSPIEEMQPDRKTERAGTRRTESPRQVRETTLCNSSGYKQQSRECCSEKHGCGRGSSKAVKLFGAEQHKEKALGDGLNQSPVNHMEAGGEASNGRKGLASPSIAAKIDYAKCESSSQLEETNMPKEDDDVNVDRNRQYEMLASLLLDDSLDIDQDFDQNFDLALSPLQADSQFYGSIFGDDIDFGGSEAILGTEMLDGNRKCEGQPSRLFVDVTNKFKIQATPAVKEQVKENDSHRLAQRQKQINFGKNTLGYERYIELVPRWKRTRRDPQTPNAKQVCSKRSWDGQICKWRRLLHEYDPPLEENEELPEDFTISQSDNVTDQNTHLVSCPIAKLKTNLHKPAAPQGLLMDDFVGDRGSKLALRTGSCFDVSNQSLKNVSCQSKGKGNSSTDCGTAKVVICRRKEEAKGSCHPITGMSAQSSRFSIYEDWKEF